MRALIAMSGGVDSSVAAKLMIDQGYECVGCTMKLYNNEDAGIPKSNTCCSIEDIDDARNVSYKLSIDHYVFNFTDDFNKKVIRKFVRCYEAGITPNPCIDCNNYMKFEKLFDRADILGCDYIVTGHYARIEQHNGRYILKKAVDSSKDQSYVLYNMTQAQLSRICFPLGELKKSEVREIAANNGFVNAKKSDSQDICFVPNGDYASVIRIHSKNKQEPGNFVDSAGNVLGKHKGIIHYTIGQHRKLGLSLSEARYVCRICPESNTVVLGKEKELYSKELDARDFNWISGSAPKKSFRCKVKIRYRQQEQWAVVIPTGNNVAHIVFDNEQRAIAPGQSAVLYDNDIVLGGGIII